MVLETLGVVKHAADRAGECVCEIRARGGKRARRWRQYGKDDALFGVGGGMARIDPELLGHLFDEHASALVLYARQWSGRPEDIVQDAFVALARQRRRPDRVLPWLYRVVRNASIAEARSDRRRREREALASGTEGWFATADEQLDAADA